MSAIVTALYITALVLSAGAVGVGFAARVHLHPQPSESPREITYLAMLAWAAATCAYLLLSRRRGLDIFALLFFTITGGIAGYQGQYMPLWVTEWRRSTPDWAAFPSDEAKYAGDGHKMRVRATLVFAATAAAMATALNLILALITLIAVVATGPKRDTIRAPAKSGKSKSGKTKADKPTSGRKFTASKSNLVISQPQLLTFEDVYHPLPQGFKAAGPLSPSSITPLMLDNEEVAGAGVAGVGAGAGAGSVMGAGVGSAMDAGGAGASASASGGATSAGSSTVGGRTRTSLYDLPQGILQPLESKSRSQSPPTRPARSDTPSSLASFYSPTTMTPTMPIIPFPEPAASASYNNYAPAARVNSRGGPAARVTYYNDYLPEDI